MDQLLKYFRQYQVILSRNPLYAKYNLFFFPVITIIIALLILFLVTIPQTFKLITNNELLEELKQKKTVSQTKIRTLNEVDTSQYKTDLNDVLTILPNEKEIPSAINSILQLISLSGLTLTNFSIGTNGKPINGVENFIVSIDITGSANQIKDLINFTEQSSRLIKITGLNLNYGSDGVSQTSMDVLVFYAPLDTSIKTDNSQTLTLLSPEDQALLDKIKQNTQTVSSAQTDTPILDGPTGKDDPFN